MRVLTVKQPWAWAIIHGGKDVENRVQSLGPYRGPVAIHAALGWSDFGAEDWELRRAICSDLLGWRADDGEVWAADTIEPDDPMFVRGAVIGVVNRWAEHRPRPGCCPNLGVRPFGGPWAMPDHWHSNLSDPRPLARPIPHRGGLGLRHAPADLVAAISDQLGEVA